MNKNLMGAALKSWLGGEIRIVMLGLDGAGKSTVLYWLLLGEVASQMLPSSGFNVETVRGEGGAGVSALYR